MTNLDERPRFNSTHGALGAEWKWLQELTKETSKLRATKRYRDWLNATANHWHYSPFNRVLIGIQKADAVLVAGRRVWEARGRTVKPGAKQISILAPAGRRFVGVVVFDLSDTEGPPLKIDSWALKGGSERLEATRDAAKKLKVELTWKRLSRSIYGHALPGRKIEVQSKLAPAQEVATLVHEYAHVLLGHHEERAGLSTIQREAEAEATAYIVLRSIGAKSKAPEYLNFYGVHTNVLRSSFQHIGKAAETITTAILGKRKPAHSDSASRS